MKLAIFGATGKTGVQLVKQALEKGHTVTAFVRDPAQQITLDEDCGLKFDTSSLFQHAHGHYEIYRTLVWGSGFKLIIVDGQVTLSREIEDRLEFLLTNKPGTSIPLPVLANTMSGVLLVLLKWWLDNKIPYSPKRMDEIFQQLMMPGIQTALE